MQSRRITIATTGSRGDVQPFIALAQALIKRGHIVKIATELRVQSYVEEYDIPHIALKGDNIELFHSSVQKESNIGVQVLESYRTALSDAEVIVASGYAVPPAYSVAQSLGVPFVPMYLQPVMPTSEFVSLFTTPLMDLLCCFNKKWTHYFISLFMFSLYVPYDKTFGFDDWRQNVLGLPPLGMGGILNELLKHPDIPILMACSALTCGRNKCKPKDYDDRMHVGGLLFVEYEEPTIDPHLVAFLSQEDISSNRGEEVKAEVSRESIHKKSPVIYIGFGSMAIPDPLSFLRTVCEVCSVVQCRVVLVAGWSDFTSCTSCIKLLNAHKDIVYLAKSVNHEWLFPRMQCVVHHCGMGTMGAVLRSGTPSIPCPVFLDQPKLAKLLVDHGLAPCQIPFHKINTTNLSKALKMILDPKRACIFNNCEEAAKFVEQESKDSVEMYCDIITSADISKQWKKNEELQSATKVAKVAEAPVLASPQYGKFLANLHVASGLSSFTESLSFMTSFKSRQ